MTSGVGSFENDTALDWASAVQTIEDVREPFARLKVYTDGHPDGGDATIDADFACELIAAAETVAMLMGRKVSTFPQELATNLAGAGAPDDLMFHQARNAVLCVLRNSELAELWLEATEDGEENDWNAEITHLIDRLNPEIDYMPWEDKYVEEHNNAAIGKCCFCDGEIVRAELFGLNVHDYADMVVESHGLWCHLRCLNGRLHHKYVISNLKFDPDNEPDLDLL
jgi:hypothetical protein